MKPKLKNILENTFQTDIGIICIDNASSGFSDYQMKQRIKHTRLNLEYSGYEYTTLVVKLTASDKVVNASATVFLVVDSKNDQMLREKLLKLSKYYKIPSFCWISANSHEIQTISVNDTSSDVVSVPFDFENSNELSFDINGVRLLLSLDLIVDIPRNYFNRTKYLGKLGIASGAKGKWERIVIK
jgi:hypothetical protein